MCEDDERVLHTETQAKKAVAPSNAMRCDPIHSRAIHLHHLRFCPPAVRRDYDPEASSFLGYRFL
jgi:hypothetical protein